MPPLNRSHSAPLLRRPTTAQEPAQPATTSRTPLARSRSLNGLDRVAAARDGHAPSPPPSPFAPAPAVPVEAGHATPKAPSEHGPAEAFFDASEELAQPNAPFASDAAPKAAASQAAPHTTPATPPTPAAAPQQASRLGAALRTIGWGLVGATMLGVTIGICFTPAVGAALALGLVAAPVLYLVAQKMKENMRQFVAASAPGEQPAGSPEGSARHPAGDAERPQTPRQHVPKTATLDAAAQGHGAGDIDAGGAHGAAESPLGQAHSPPAGSPRGTARGERTPASARSGPTIPATPLPQGPSAPLRVHTEPASPRGEVRREQAHVPGSPNSPHARALEALSEHWQSQLDQSEAVVQRAHRRLVEAEGHRDGILNNLDEIELLKAERYDTVVRGAALTDKVALQERKNAGKVKALEGRNAARLARLRSKNGRLLNTLTEGQEALAKIKTKLDERIDSLTLGR